MSLVVDMFAFNINNLSLSYHDKPLLTQLNLKIKQGKWIALLGRSGCGKSTLLKAIAGLKHSAMQQGEIQLNGRIAYMAQQDCLLPWLSVLDNVQLSSLLKKQRNRKSVKQAQHLLDIVGLCGEEKKFPYQLSGGQRQRVALARTLMLNADIILMDEPFSAVDAITRLALQKLSAQLLQNKTVVLITHDPLEAIRLADTIYLFNNNSLTQPFYPQDKRPRFLPSQAQAELQQQLLEVLT